jgi:DNA-binding NtrC family response regulator
MSPESRGFQRSRDGIALGSVCGEVEGGAVMGGEKTYPSVGCGLAAAHDVDRRCGAVAVLTAATAGLSVVREPRLVRERFEEEVRALLSARSVALRDEGAQPALPRPNTLSLDLPTASPDRRARIEAVFDASRRMDGWTRQVLEAGAHVAALLLELERAQSRFGARPPGDGAAPLIGSSAAMRALRHKIERVAATDFTVLIDGESGTGKELVARQIHELSRRRTGPFVAINCAALVETLLEAELFGIEERTATGVRGRRGKFEHADGGTLFLDEVSDLSASAQAKLLRAIQDLAVERVGGHGTHRVDLRIIAATNRSLSTMVAGGLFRSDLFYRLGGVDVPVPPLRARQGDIVELAEYFLDRHRETRRLELSAAVKDALRSYEWPGNVRELQRVIENIVALASTERVELDDLPPILRGDYEEVLRPALARDETMRAWGSRYARLVLQRCGDNKRRACDVLGISYHTLQAYLEYQDRRATRVARASDGWATHAEANEDDGQLIVES